jgi:D-psicose/D-tagatose/L-ribulose 3-epimerase
MKFGINSFLYTASFERPQLDLLPQIKEWGFDGVEVARFEFTQFSGAEIRKAAEAAGLGVTLCSALTGDLSLVSEDAAIRAKAKQFIEDGVKYAADLGSPVFAGPFCAPVGLLLGRRRNDDEWKRAVEGLQSIGPVLASCKVALAVEPLNRFETYFLNTCADAAKLCREVGDPNVGILFDTFHANIEEKHAGDAIRTAAPYLKHVHTCENDRGIPGSGHVDWPGVAAALREVNYNGWGVIESFGAQIKEIAAAACIWRDLAPATDDIARDGVKFLRALLN